MHKELKAIGEEKHHFCMVTIKEHLKPSWIKDIRALPDSVKRSSYPQDIYRYLKNLAWIKEIYFVRILPEGILRIRFTPRKPLLAVRKASHFIFIDEDGIILPGEYDQVSLKSEVYEVYGVEEPPHAGLKWGDKRIEAVLSVVKAIKRAGVTRELPIEKIDLSREDGMIVLWIEGGRRIIWGREGSFKGFGDLKIKEKIKNLLRILELFPKLRGIKIAKLYLKDMPVVIKEQEGGYVAKGKR
jgi:hypothetical protein